MKPRFLSAARLSFPLAAAIAALLNLAAPSALAATIYWDGTSATWNTAANWSTASGAATPDPVAVPGAADDVIFNITTVNGAETITLDANQAVNSMTFNNTGTTALTGGGTARTLSLGAGGITMASGAGAVTLGSGVVGNNVLLNLAGAQTWTNNSANAFTINNTAATFTRQTGATLTFNKVGAGNFAVTSGVTLANGIIGPWAFFGTGATQRYATITAGNVTGLAGTTAATVNSMTSATANYEYSAASSTAGATTLTANTIRNSAGSSNSIALYNGTNTQSYDLIVNGILAVGTGTFTISRSAAGTADAGLIIGATGELVIAGSQAVTISAPIQEGAAGRRLTYSGSNTLTLSGVNTYTGATTVSSGILSLNNSLALQNSPLNTAGSIAGSSTNGLKTNQTSLTLGGLTGDKNFAATGGVFTTTSGGYGSVTALTLNPGASATHSYSGVIANGAAAGMSLTKSGAGNQILTGANTFSGATLVSAGTLTLGDGTSNLGSLINTSGITVTGAILAVNRTGAFTQATDLNGKVITGTGGFSQIGSGTTTLSLANNYTGTTTVDGGVLISTGTSNNGVGTTTLAGAAGTKGMLYVPSGSYSSTSFLVGSNTAGSIGSIVVDGGSLTATTAATNAGIILGSGASTYGGLFLSSGSITANRIDIGVTNTNTTATGVLRVTGGTLTSTEYIIARSAKFEFTVTGGLVDHSAASQNIALGWNSGGRGTMTVAGGTVDNTGRSITIRENGLSPNVSINLNGGNTITNSIVKNNAAGTGVLNFNGGTLTAGTTGGALVNGSNGLTAYVNGAFGSFSGGAVIDTAGLATNTISANLLAPTGNGVSGLSVGSAGSGYIGAPIVEIDGDGTGATGYAVVDLNPSSGTFGKVTSVVLTNPGIGYTTTPTVTLSGGGGSGAGITASGITANTSGGLTKQGLGTLTLSGATNTYSGATTISAGTLVVNGSISNSTIGLNSGTLTGSGTVNAVNVANAVGNVISNNNGVAGASLTIGALTFNGAATVNTFSASSAAPIITTTLTGNGSTGTVTINPTAASWTTGSTYDLISYGGSIGGSGGFGQFVRGPVTGLTARQSASNLINNPGSAIQITISGDVPKWTGALGNEWSTATLSEPKNWVLQTAATTTDFLDTDDVLFDDTATSFAPVITGSNVSPFATTFNNSTNNYTLSSTGGFGIASGTLTKNGTGTVTISSVNTYTGATAINAGTVIMSGSGTLGTGSALTLGGGNLDLGTTSQTVGAVSVTTPATSGDTISNGSLTGTSYAASNTTGNATISANLLGAGTFAKSGAGTATLSGANTYSGITTISGGTLSLTGSLSNAGLGNINVNAGGTLDISGTLSGNVAATALNFSTTSVASIVNVSSGANISNLLNIKGSTGVGIYNQTGGSVTIGATGTNDTNVLATTGYGNMNLSGGTYTVNSRFTVTNGAGHGVARVGGGAGSATLSVFDLLSVGRATNATGELTVLPNGVVSVGNGSFNILLGGNAASSKSFVNIVGGTFSSPTKAIQQGNGTTSTGTLAMVNLGAGTLEIGANMATSTNTTVGGTNRGYVNFTGGTLKLLNTGMTTVLPAINANGFSGGQANTIFGQVSNSTANLNGTGASTGITGQDFGGGLTIDTNGFATNTISVPLVAPSGGGVAQGNLTLVGGSGYIAPPTVTFSNPTAVGSTPAAGYALVSGGQVTGIVITSPGSYTSGDTVTVNFGGGGGTGASVTSIFGSSLAANTSGGLTKIGLGSLTLTATNTYTGATLVSAGTLVINGSISTSSLTTVASGATIAGSGSVGALTVAAGGFITPGNGPGTLTMGDYTQLGLYTADITGLIPNTEHDQIIVNGLVDIAGGSLTAAFTGSGYAVNDMIFLLLNDGTDSINGTYTGFNQGDVVTTYGGFDWQISYVADSFGKTFSGGNDIALMAAAIPEPSAAALLGVLGAMLLLRRRR